MRGSRHGADRDWFCRSIDSHDGRRRRRRDVQRSGVPADEQPAARDQRPQFRQVELAEIDDPVPPRPPSACRAAAAIRLAASRSDGPELSTIRRRGDACASPATRAAKAGSGQRRNGLPALTCATISSCSGPMPAARRAAARCVPSRPRLAASPPDRAPVPARRVRPPRRSLPADPTGSRPNAVRRNVRGRATSSRVHPGPALDVVADSLRRTGRQCQPRAARTAVQIDHQVEPCPAQPPREPQIVTRCAPARAPCARRSPRRGAGCRSPPARPPRSTRYVMRAAGNARFSARGAAS